MSGATPSASSAASHMPAPHLYMRALARICLDVEEIGHALGRIGAEFLGVIGDHVGEEIGRRRVVPAEPRPHLGLVDDRIVDRLDHALLAERDRRERVGVDEVPGRLAALELRRDGAFGRPGAVLFDRDAGLLEERLPKGLIIGLDRVAAPIDENELLLGGAGASGAERKRSAGERDRRQLREAAAADLAPLRLCGQGYRDSLSERRRSSSCSCL